MLDEVKNSFSDNEDDAVLRTEELQDTAEVVGPQGAADSDSNNIIDGGSHMDPYEKLSDVSSLSEDDDDEEIRELIPSAVKVPSIVDQRAQFREANQSDINYNDPVFMVPASWLSAFLGDPELEALPTVEAMQKLGPINTSSVLVNPQNPNMLNHNFNYDYNAQSYTAVSKKAWDLLLEWYGLTQNSVSVPRSVIQDKKTGSVRIEFHLPSFNLKKLSIGSLSKINSNVRYNRLLFDNQEIFFSSVHTVKELYEYIFEFIKGNLAVSEAEKKEIKLRIWYLEDQGLENLPLILNLTLFKKVANKKLLSQDLFDKRLTDIGILGGYLLLEINDYRSNKFPTESLLRKLEDLENCGSSLIPQDSEENESDSPEFKPASKGALIESNPSDGTKGFNNIGNTCYMNSALQCLVHIPELANYFYHNIHSKELNTSNPLGSEGKIANSFGNLIHQLFEPKGKNRYSFTPREFKSVIGNYNSMFYGHQQQDSQEFLACLLDALHEDLNRIINKPYTEKPELSPDLVNDKNEVRKLAENCWKNHKLRNDSVILDLFVGLYKSTLRCPECNNVSLSFDPFSDLTLPIPIATKWTHQVYILRDEENTTVKRFEVELSKIATYETLKGVIAKRLFINPKELFGFEIFQNQFYRNFEDAEHLSDSKFLPIGDLISAEDTIIFYELKDYEKAHIIVPVINTVKEEYGFNSSKAFGFPFFIKLSEEEVKSFGSIREKIESRYNSLTTYKYFSTIRRNSTSEDNGKKRKFFKTKDFPQIEKLLAKNGVEVTQKESAKPEAKKLKKTDSSDGSAASFYENPQIESKRNVSYSKEHGTAESLSTEKENTNVSSVDDTNDDSDFELVEQHNEVPSNSQISGYADDPEYDSDISIANPELSSNYAFEIKLYNGNNYTRRNYGYSYNRFAQPSAKSETPKIWAPYTSGQFSNMKSLIDKLPLPKKLFYSYSVDDYNDLSSFEDMNVKVPVADGNGENKLDVGSMDAVLEPRKGINPAIYTGATDSAIQSLEGSIQELEKPSVNDLLSKFSVSPVENSGNREFGNPIDISDDENCGFGAIHLSDTGEGDNGSSISRDDNLAPLLSDRNPLNTSAGSGDDLKYTLQKPQGSQLPIDNHPVLVSSNDALVCEWDQNLYQVFFSGKEEDGEGGQSTWDHPQVVPNPELEENRRKMEEMKSKNLTLQDCLNTFSQSEILGQNDLWYCPTCKEHRQAEKKIEIWSTPDILTIHLKRFENQRRFSDKIDAVIEFPIQELDMSKFIANEADNDKSNIYDLFAVDNHYGGLGGGHYTAYVKNFVDDKWYYYDDSSVMPTNPERSIAGSAYLLFYRRRSVDMLGGAKFGQLLDEARKEKEIHMQKQKTEEIKKVKDIVQQIDHYKSLASSSTGPKNDTAKVADNASQKDVNEENKEIAGSTSSDFGLSDGELSSYSASVNPPS